MNKYDLAGDSTEAASVDHKYSTMKLPKIPQHHSFFKVADGKGPLSNYKNVDLYKIPEKTHTIKQRFKDTSMRTQIDNFRKLSIAAAEGKYTPEKLNTTKAQSETQNVFT